MICTPEQAKKKKCVFKAIGTAILFAASITDPMNFHMNERATDCVCIADECMTAWRWESVDRGYCGLGGAVLSPLQIAQNSHID